jgi:hypothetical protein
LNSETTWLVANASRPSGVRGLHMRLPSDLLKPVRNSAVSRLLMSATWIIFSVV